MEHEWDYGVKSGIMGAKSGITGARSGIMVKRDNGA